MGNTSTAQQLHDMLCKQDIGFKFTMYTLKGMAEDEGIEDVTDGAISGFIHKLVKKNRAKYDGKVNEGGNNRLLYQYELLNKEPWPFKGKSKGSPAGRQINRTPNAQLEVQVEELLQEQHKLVLSNEEPVQVQSLFMRLLDLAAEVEALEKKSLKDYSSDELIAELKTRVK